VPGKFKLPLRIRLTFSIDAPALYLLLGKGHVTVGSGWQDNRRIGDIVEPETKPRAFPNGMDMGRETELEVAYGRRSMRIIIDGRASARPEAAWNQAEGRGDQGSVQNHLRVAPRILVFGVYRREPHAPSTLVVHEGSPTCG
jgi:hypothetical protein